MDATVQDLIALIERREPASLMRATDGIEKIMLSSSRRDFVKLQDSFAYNVAGRLMLQLELCLSDAYPVPATIAFLRLMRGLCLVHRPSRAVFDTDHALRTLVSKGIMHTASEVQEQSLYALVSVLVRQVSAIRRFEALGELKTICSQFKNPRTAKSVKLAILQFLFFYLVPETRVPNLERTVPRKNTADKQQMLNKYLSNTDGLVRELETNRPFGSGEIEW